MVRSYVLCAEETTCEGSRREKRRYTLSDRSNRTKERMVPIRNAAKAVIIEGGRLLVTKNRDREGAFYFLPGGGQETGETLREALVRECFEEAGTRVEVGDLLFVREYIAAHHEFADSERDVHQVELMFACRRLDEEDPPGGAVPDSWQIGVGWLDAKDLGRARFYLAALKEAPAPARAGRRKKCPALSRGRELKRA
jgi:8-oxo-dGTP pyrophosphatase MutT (NUDIX family)